MQTSLSLTPSLSMALVIFGLPRWQMVKNASANTGDARDMGPVSRLGRSLGEGGGKPFQYSCLENSMDKGAWRATVHKLQRVRHD